MSTQDSQFFTMVSLVIGTLVAVAVMLFGLSRVLGGEKQKAEVYDDPLYVAQLSERLAPVGRIAIAGQDNSALAIKPSTPAAAITPALAVPANGAQLYQAVCSTCHGAGIAGAPRAGDKAAWGPRIAEGKETLYQHALQGYQGKTGIMPAKGGRPDLPDALIEQGVNYMVSMEK